LAEHVAGTVHVDAMLEEMTPQEFDEWCIRDQIEPIGFTSQSIGLLTYLVASYLSGGKSSAEDYMPWLQHQPVQTQASQNAQARDLLKSIAAG